MSDSSLQQVVDIAVHHGVDPTDLKNFIASWYAQHGNLGDPAIVTAIAQHYGLNVTIKTSYDQWIGDAMDSALSGVKGIPLAGPLFHGVLGAAFAPIQLGKDIVDGKRLDRALVDSVNREMRNVKEIAPYAQMVISVFPGIGPVASAAIGAGLALASGQGIDDALMAGVKGALPGGPLAETAFEVGKGAIEGQNVSTAIIQGLGSEINLPPEATAALVAGFNIVQQATDGKRVDVAAADTLIQQGQDLIPGLTSDERDALSLAVKTGSSLAQGKKLQDVVSENAPELINALEEKGASVAKLDKLVATARAAIPSDVGQQGFDIGLGIMQQQVGIQQFNLVRKSLHSDDQKGFDMAVSFYIGRAKKVPISRLSMTAMSALPREELHNARLKDVGYFTTHGMARATVRQKSGIMSSIARVQPMRAGAVVAIKEVAAERESFWHKLWHFLFWWA